MEKSNIPVLYFVEVNGMYVSEHKFSEQVYFNDLNNSPQRMLSTRDEVTLTSDLKKAEPIESERLAKVIAKKMNGEVLIFMCCEIYSKENGYGQLPKEDPRKTD